MNPRLVIIVAIAVVTILSVTAIVVMNRAQARDNAVVQELKRDDRERKAGQDEARRWMTVPPRPKSKPTNELGL